MRFETRRRFLTNAGLASALPLAPGLPLAPPDECEDVIEGRHEEASIVRLRPRDQALTRPEGAQFLDSEILDEESGPRVVARPRDGIAGQVQARLDRFDRGEQS